MTPEIRTPLALPCGATLPNRLCKAALTEGLADSMNRATPALERLSSRRPCSSGRAGVLTPGHAGRPAEQDAGLACAGLEMNPVARPEMQQTIPVASGPLVVPRTAGRRLGDVKHPRIGKTFMQGLALGESG